MIEVDYGTVADLQIKHRNTVASFGIEGPILVSAGGTIEGMIPLVAVTGFHYGSALGAVVDGEMEIGYTIASRHGVQSVLMIDSGTHIVLSFVFNTIAGSKIDVGDGAVVDGEIEGHHTVATVAVGVGVSGGVGT